MRFVFTLIAAACAFVAAPQPTAAQSPQAATRDVSEAHLSAARDMLHAFLIDTGMVEVTSFEAFDLMGAQFRDPIVGSAMYRALSPARQQALLAYIDGLAPIVRDEAVLGAPQVIEQFAARTAALFTERELNEIATYLRTPEGTANALRVVRDGMQTQALGRQVRSEPTEAEAAADVAFRASPGGRAFYSGSPQFGAMMRELGAQSVGGPHIRERIQRDMCAVLEDDCPPGWRS